MSYKTLRFLLLFLCISAQAKIANLCINLVPYIGIGPAWHQIDVYKKFKLPASTIAIQSYPSNEMLKTNFNTMMYGEGALQVSITDYFAIRALVSGGKTTNGSGSVDYIVQQEFFEPLIIPTQYTTPAKTTVSLLIFDIDGLINIPIKKYPFIINTHIGYVHNTEKTALTTAKSQIHYALKNNWDGPYIGLGATLFSQKYSLNAFYKCVLGKVHSYFKLTAPPSFFTSNDLFMWPLNTGPTCWKTAMVGSLFCINGTYTLCDTISIGTKIQYMLYRNRNDACIRFTHQPQALVNKALVRQQFWQQIAWTFYGEFCY